jgi:hypothetical protein
VGRERQAVSTLDFLMQRKRFTPVRGAIAQLTDERFFGAQDTEGRQSSSAGKGSHPFLLMQTCSARLTSLE